MGGGKGMNGLNPDHLRNEVVRPVLEHMNMWSQPAEDLVVGTAIVESGLRHLRQFSQGPALGIYQMEPDTASDCWRYMRDRPDIAVKVQRLLSPWPSPKIQLIGNLNYATAICRVKYWMDPKPIPDDLEGQAAIWKRVWNTPKGRGTAPRYILDYRRVMNGG